jgi:hypothetical protein
MTSFRKSCVYCQTEIEMSDKNGKWQAFEIMTGDFHSCLSIKRSHIH